MPAVGVLMHTIDNRKKGACIRLSKYQKGSMEFEDILSHGQKVRYQFFWVLINTQGRMAGFLIERSEIKKTRS